MTPSNHLFAYGTLMAGTDAGDPTGLGAAERGRLAREGHLVGGAKMTGLLYDLGSYPGLVEAIGGDQAANVMGELWRLDDPAATFDWLDRYEGIDAAAPDRAEYRRLVRAARLTGEAAGSVAAWVYVYAGDVSSARLLAGGDWLTRR